MFSARIIDIISSKSAVSPRAGLKAYEIVAAQIHQNTPAQISFSGVEDLTSAFCNAFIGKLYMNFDPQVLNNLLLITDIDHSGIWAKKISNAILLGTNENARTLHKTNIEDVIFA